MLSTLSSADVWCDCSHMGYRHRSSSGVKWLLSESTSKLTSKKATWVLPFPRATAWKSLLAEPQHEHLKTSGATLHLSKIYLMLEAPENFVKGWPGTPVWIGLSEDEITSSLEAKFCYTLATYYLGFPLFQTMKNWLTLAKVYVNYFYNFPKII